MAEETKLKEASQVISQYERASISTLRRQLGAINRKYSNSEGIKLSGDYGSSQFTSKESENGNARFGTFLGRGASRETYETSDPEWVVKVPRSDSGADQNIWEAERFKLLEPYGLAPRHRLEWVDEVPIMFVERLTSMDENQDESSVESLTVSEIHYKLGLNDWVQTGLTKDGRRVFSDLGI